MTNKKIKLLSFLLLSITLNLYSQIETFGYLEGGLGRYTHSIYNNKKQDFYNSSTKKLNLYTSINFGLRYKKFDIINTVETFMSYHGKTSFRPVTVEYIFNAVYRIYDKFEVGYKHSCTHPTFSNTDFYDEMIYRAAYDKLYLKIKFNK